MERPAQKFETVTILGTEVTLDDESWHYIMVFPLVTKETQSEFEKTHSNPVKAAKKLFSKRAWDEVNDGDAEFMACKNIFKDGMSVLDYHQAVRLKIAQLLCGSRLGLKVATHVTVDKDEMFLKIELEDDAAMRALAARVDLPMALKEEIYDNYFENGLNPDDITVEEFASLEHKCPTTDYKHGAFQGDDYAPAYIPYADTRKHMFKPFREVDRMHVSLWRIEEFLKIDHLISQGILKQMFPVHKYTGLQELHQTGWCSPWGIITCDWYNARGVMDKVRNYYGEEVAFFFHWLLFYTRYLVPVSILSLVVFFRRSDLVGLTLEQQRYIAIAFGFVMLLWSSIFVEKYDQASASKIIQWGMTKWNGVAPARPEFDLKKRGSYKELLQNGFHWFLVALFVGETILVTAWICQLRLDIKSHPEGVYFGLQGENAEMVGKYLITINIKIVAAVWGFLSPTLTGWENHKTKQELKSAMVIKIFIVKAVVYFYPFLYIAFLKKYFEGCGLDADGNDCIPELNENLAIFFATHIATVLVMILFSVGVTKFSIMREISNAKEKHGMTEAYSYLELQSKCPQYLNDTDDFMELIFSLAFVMMFSAALPVMAWLAFACNVVEMKILAWRMVYVNQRSVPTGQHGIGIWSDIIKAICVLSILCNVGLVVFAMHPVQDLHRTTKLMLFIIAQNVAMAFKQAIQFCYRDRGVNLLRIDEVNEEVVDSLFGGQDEKVTVPETIVPKSIGLVNAQEEV